ncbi:MAG TPA: hypothetical protein VLA09_04685, partial [Longimicrobiales bacterium]|nr:hypothetical protein [Longimicrobiales bacterium]
MQQGVDQPTHDPQRVVGWNAVLDRSIAEQDRLPLVATAHRPAPGGGCPIYGLFRLRKTDFFSTLVGLGASPDGFGSLTARGRLDDRTSLLFSIDSRRLDAGRQDFDRSFDPLEDAQYPILGDASAVQTLSSSRYAVSARIERGFDWVAFGDVSTAGFADGLELTTYRRALSGGMAQVTTGPVSWRSFGTVTDQSLQQVQIRGAGVSGPYQLGANVSPSTEQIVIETRDRENAQRVVSRQVLVRYVDYEIDYETGTLLFKQPVPATDLAENPVFLVVTYEASAGGEQRLVGGMRAAIDAMDLLGS